MPGQFMPLAMAGGGVFSRPTLGLVAEAGYPEAVIPMPSGNVPVRILGGGGRTISISLGNIVIQGSSKSPEQLAREIVKPLTRELRRLENIQ
jgi:hypothetical protein